MNASVTVTAPFRLPIAGGGSDLPSVYAAGGGKLLAVALQERLTVHVNLRSDGRVRTSQGAGPWGTACNPNPEKCLTSAAVVTLHSLGADVQIDSPISPGAGLGGSGAFTVALTVALSHLSGRSPCNKEIVERAVHIERDIYGSPVGVQDAAVAAIGGLLQITVDDRGTFSIEQNESLYNDFQRRIAPQLILVDTGIRRSARRILSGTVTASRCTEFGRRMRHQVDRFASIISSGDVEAFGNELSQHWQEKRLRTTNMTSAAIDATYSLGMDAGCIGGKLIGAGGGGYFLFAAPKSALEIVRASAAERGLETRAVMLGCQRGWILDNEPRQPRNL